MTDYKLKGEDLKYVFENTLGASIGGLVPGQLIVYYAPSNASYERLSSIFRSLYNVQSSRVVGSGGVFYFEFSNANDGIAALQDIDGAIAQYQEQNPDAKPPKVTSTSALYDDISNEKVGSADWTTYLIIGAAVVAILILIWPSKKRK